MYCSNCKELTHLNHEPMRYTSIQAHERNMNYQSDFQGLREVVIEKFKQECLRKDVIWSKLFEEKSGEIVASFFKEGTQWSFKTYILGEY